MCLLFVVSYKLCVRVFDERIQTIAKSVFYTSQCVLWYNRQY